MSNQSVSIWERWPDAWRILGLAVAFVVFAVAVLVGKPTPSSLSVTTPTATAPSSPTATLVQETTATPAPAPGQTPATLAAGKTPVVDQTSTASTQTTRPAADQASVIPVQDIQPAVSETLTAPTPAGQSSTQEATVVLTTSASGQPPPPTAQGAQPAAGPTLTVPTTAQPAAAPATDTVAPASVQPTVRTPATPAPTAQPAAPHVTVAPTQVVQPASGQPVAAQATPHSGSQPAGGQQQVSSASTNLPFAPWSRPAGAGPQVDVRIDQLPSGISLLASIPRIGGIAPASATVRLYDLQRFVAQVAAGTDGRWLVELAGKLLPGDHLLWAEVVTPQGTVLAVSQPLPLTVASQATPVIQQPAASATLKEIQPVLSGTGKPGERVRIYADTRLVGETTVTQGGEWKTNSSQPLTQGQHDVRAVVVDERGRILAQSAPVTVVVPQPARSLPITGGERPEPDAKAASNP